jgi:hypothetical protein
MVVLTQRTIVSLWTTQQPRFAGVRPTPCCSVEFRPPYTVFNQIRNSAGQIVLMQIERLQLVKSYKASGKEPPPASPKSRCVRLRSFSSSRPAVRPSNWYWAQLRLVTVALSPTSRRSVFRGIVDSTSQTMPTPVGWSAASRRSRSAAGFEFGTSVPGVHLRFFPEPPQQQQLRRRGVLQHCNSDQ